MAKRNWTKLGTMIGFVAFIAWSLQAIYSLTDIESALKYFALILVLLFAVFVYFEFLKEYPTPRSKEPS